MMTKVDNSGKGNCLYYAYGISLMYYLRALNNEAVTEDIFNKLKLTEDEKVLLRAPLTNGSILKFSALEIEIIEDVLGKATRNLAAAHIEQEFINSPQASALFSNAHYGIEFFAKEALLSINSPLGNLLEPKPRTPNVVNSEIYRLHNIENKMKIFVEKRILNIVKKFNKQISIHPASMKDNPSEEDIQIHQANILDNILREETVRFFIDKNRENLTLYKKHLQTNYVWGTEETAKILNTAIRGERQERNISGTLDTKQENYINIHFYKNGRSVYTPQDVPHIILNNQWQGHWTSLIPNSYLESADANYKNGKILDIEDILNNLKMKIYTINKDMKPKAWEAAKDLLKQLESAKNIYFRLLESDVLSKNESINIFKDLCVSAIKEKLPILEKDLGWGTYLWNMVKKISSIIITFGQNSNFFPSTKPASVKAVSDTLYTIEKFKNNELLKPLKQEGPEEIKTLTLKSK